MQVDFNINNLSQKTNYVLGSNELKLVPIFATTVSIPGINFSHPEVGGRFGPKLHVSSDFASFNSISCDCLIDENMKILLEILKIMRNAYSPHDGSFANRSFDFWLQLHNNKGNPVFRIDFNNSRLVNFSDITLSTQDDTNSGTFTIEINYDSYELSVFDSLSLEEKRKKFFNFANDAV